MISSRRVGTIAGIEVRLDWSLLLIAALLTFSLASGLLPASIPSLTGVGAVVLGLTGAVAFLASILAHELGHSLVAQREGVRVKSVTLWLLGGLAELSEEPRSARSEFRIAAAGPAVSIGLAVLFGAAAFALGPLHLAMGVLLGWLALVNGVLAVFNLLPAAPLDGGRILRAILWRINGDRWRSLVTSARLGQLLALVLGAVAVWQFLGGIGGGIWTGLLAWFIWTAAGSERRHGQRQLRLQRIRDQARQQSSSWWFGPVAAQATAAETSSDPQRIDLERLD